MNSDLNQSSLNVWIVDEASPGHLSQSEGLVNAMSKLQPVQSVLIEGRAHIRGWQRHLLRLMMGDKARAFSDSWLRRIAKFSMPKDAGRPDLIVSSGGKSVFVGQALALRCDVPYIFIGERKPYPESWFHTIVSPVPTEASAKTVDVELIPTPVASNQSIREGAFEAGVWCMVIGGASRSHHFKESDWTALARGMNQLSEKYGIRWRVTTSRRTGAKAESILREYLDQANLIDAIWWAEAPRRELYAFMMKSEVLCVTQDSVTMVTEAVSACRPVVVVRPAMTEFSSDSFLPEYFARLERNARILRVDASELGQVKFVRDQFKLLDTDLMEPVAVEVLKRIQAS